MADGAKKTIPEYEYRFAVDGYMGWCTNCQDFTRYETEPDAIGYDCPSCHGKTVIGAEFAMLGDVFNIDFSDSSRIEA